MTLMLKNSRTGDQNLLMLNLFWRTENTLQSAK